MTARPTGLAYLRSRRFWMVFLGVAVFAIAGMAAVETLSNEYLPLPETLPLDFTGLASGIIWLLASVALYSANYGIVRAVYGPEIAKQEGPRAWRETGIFFVMTPISSIVAVAGWEAAVWLLSTSVFVTLPGMSPGSIGGIVVLLLLMDSGPFIAACEVAYGQRGEVPTDRRRGP